MLSTFDFLQYVKSVSIAENWGFNSYQVKKLNKNKEKQLVFYNITRRDEKLNIGGIDMTPEHILEIQLFIHWNKNYVETENIGNIIYTYFRTNNYNIDIGDNNIYYIELLSPNDDIGENEEGVYERAIDLRIRYTEKREA